MTSNLIADSQKSAEQYQPNLFGRNALVITLAILLASCGSDGTPGDSTPPSIFVESASPQGWTTDGYSLRLSGSVNDDTVVQSVSIRFGAVEFPVSLEDQSFDELVVLPSRSGEITVTARDQAGNATSKMVDVELSVCGRFNARGSDTSESTKLPTSLHDVSSALTYWYESGSEYLVMFGDGTPYAFDTTTLEPAVLPFMSDEVVRAAGPISTVYRDDDDQRILLITHDGVASLGYGGTEPVCLVSLNNLMDVDDRPSSEAVINNSAFDQVGDRMFLYYKDLSGEGFVDGGYRGTRNHVDGRLVSFDFSTRTLGVLEEYHESYTVEGPTGYGRAVDWEVPYIGYSAIRGEAIYSESRYDRDDMFMERRSSVKTSSGTLLFEQTDFSPINIIVDDIRNKMLIDFNKAPGTREYDLVTLVEQPNANLPTRIWQKSEISPLTGKLWMIDSETEFHVIDLSNGDTVYINPYEKKFRY